MRLRRRPQVPGRGRSVAAFFSMCSQVEYSRILAPYSDFEPPVPVPGSRRQAASKSETSRESARISGNDMILNQVAGSKN